MTKIRWIVAGAAVVALVYALIPSLPSQGAAVAKKADGSICPANAKKANLDFTVKDMNGETVKLSAFKGKVILLDFWATCVRRAKPRFRASSSCRTRIASKGCRWSEYRSTTPPTS